MKKFLVSLVLASSALVAAAPAAAQAYRERPYDGRGYERGYDRGYDRGYGERFQRNNWLGQRLDQISYQIQRGMDRGTITPREAQRLRGEHQQLWRVAQRYYATHGLDGRERNDLERRLDRLQQQVRYERRDDDRRGRRY